MAEPDLLSFNPLYPDQDEDTILERWREWANEGLDPDVDVDQWTDTREGSHWWTQTTPPRREAARQYDLMGTEMVAAAFPQWAWGEYLDDHGELRDLNRLAATAAQGVVTFTGDEGTIIPAGTTVGVENPDPAGDAPEYGTDAVATIPAAILPATEGVVDIPVTALTAGDAGNVPAHAVTALLSAVPGVTAVDNAAAMIGGSDTESDPALRTRILESFVGSAVANQFYYRRLALNQDGVGRATVRAADPAPGDVLIILSAPDGGPAAPAVVTAFQNLVDPDPGQGAGEGQVGATITVEASTTLAIDIDADLDLEVGYSLDGAGGTIALRSALTAAVGAYVDSVASGDEVVYVHVMGKLAGIRGVHDVPALTVNGGTVNVTVATPNVAALGAVTFTEV